MAVARQTTRKKIIVNLMRFVASLFLDFIVMHPLIRSDVIPSNIPVKPPSYLKTIHMKSQVAKRGELQSLSPKKYGRPAAVVIYKNSS